ATLYSISPIIVGDHAVISQETYLCTGTHEYRSVNFPLVSSTITIGEESWIGARAFIGPGVTVGRGAVIGACSVLRNDVPAGVVAAGNPLRIIEERKTREEGPE